MPNSVKSSKRWVALWMSGILLFIWDLGISDAVLGGLNPGMIRGRGRIHPPYPIGGVLEASAFMSVELIFLFAILRPFSFYQRPRRALYALYLFVPVWIMEFFLISGWTDQAGFVYANGHFLFMAVVFLGALSVVCFLRSWLRRRKSAVSKTA